MITTPLTDSETQWLERHVKEPPFAFLMAFAGTNYREWKLVRTFTRQEYWDTDNRKMARLAQDRFPSAIAWKVYCVHEGGTK